jgi:hypothetical protein
MRLAIVRPFARFQLYPKLNHTMAQRETGFEVARNREDKEERWTTVISIAQELV